MGILDKLGFSKKVKKPNDDLFHPVSTAEKYGMFADEKHILEKYNPSYLIGNKGIEIIDEMRRDDQIKAASYFKKSIVVAGGWEVVSPPGKPQDWEVTVFVEKVLRGLNGSIERHIIEILTGIDYGYSVTEKIWTPQDGRVVLSNLKTRHPHDITFETNSVGDVKHINQNGVLLPEDKFVVYSYDKEFDNPYGRSDLEAAYRAWWTKRNAYKWMAMLLERLGVPPIFALYDNDAYTTPVLSTLKDVISNLQAGTVGVIPRPEKDSLELWTPQIANNVGDVFIPAIEMMNKDMARAMLMPGLLGMTPDENVGSNARSRVHFDAFMQVVHRIRKDIEGHVISFQIVKQLVDFNFDVNDYPMFKLLPLSDNTQIDTLTKWAELTGKQVVKSTFDDEKHIRKMIDFPIREADNVNAEIPDKEDSLTAKVAAFSVHNMQIDFKKIESDLDKSEAEIIAKIKAHLQNSLSDLEDGVNKTQDLTRFVKQLKLTQFVKIKSDLQDNFESLVKFGYDDALGNNAQKFSSDDGPGFILLNAIKWILLKVGFISNSIKGKLESDVKQVIVEGLRTGALLPKIVDNLRTVFKPFIGDDKVSKDGKEISPYQLRTIIRTNSTSAYNQGRLTMLRENEKLLSGVRYSAILDGRTTEVCRRLNGKVFKVNDPSLDRLTPSNHYNCRSLLIPIVIGQPVDQSDFILSSETGTALGLAGEFSGEN